jgi:hypothetical protein
MKYIIVDPEEGIFLGTAKNEELEDIRGIPRGVKILALFSSHNIFEITKAVGFDSAKEAQDYLDTYISRGCPKAFVAKIETGSQKHPFVDVIDIVRSGYGEYAKDMIDSIPMHNTSIH